MRIICRIIYASRANLLDVYGLPSVYRQSSSNFTVRSVRSKPKFFQVQNRKVAILIETSRNEWRNLKGTHFCLYIINIWYTAARSHDFSSALLYDAFSKILLLLLLSLSYRTRTRANEKASRLQNAKRNSAEKKLLLCWSNTINVCSNSIYIIGNN